MFNKKKEKELAEMKLLADIKGTANFFDEEGEVRLERAVKYADEIDKKSNSGKGVTELDILQKNLYLETALLYNSMSRILNDISKDLEALV